MRIRFYFALFCGKIIAHAISILRLGAGSTWPGEIVLRISPNFVSEFLKKSNIQTIIVAGTNGKTTTASLIAYGLKKNRKKIIHNEEGANLTNGIVSALIHNISFRNKKEDCYAIFEVDENALTSVLNLVQKPKAIVLLNLFRDQLDRYGEVHSIADRWKKALSYVHENTRIIANADDPLIVSIANTLTCKEVLFFGLPTNEMKLKEFTHDTDSLYCPECGKKLIYEKIAYSHLGLYKCVDCKFHTPEAVRYKEALDSTSLVGLYNAYNISAAVLVLIHALHQSDEELFNSLQAYQPAFGRQERILYKERTWVILLSKNPAGCNQSINALSEIQTKKGPLFIILNDRVPDGTDVSWIWDVDFENVHMHSTSLVVSGDRVYDIAIRLKYSLEKQGSKPTLPYTTLSEAVQKIISLTKKGDIIPVLATYTAMLEIRKLLVGKKLL